jgi:pimeloyl-ACP methyl ester carboxylesterase
LETAGLRRYRALVPVIGLAATIVLSAARSPAIPQPQLLIRETQLTATADFRWSIPMQFRNPTEEGVYTDSLTAEATDLDDGVTHGPRSTMIPIRYLHRQLPSLGTGDSASLAFTYTALYEHARLVFHYYAHTQTGQPRFASDTIEMLPAPFSTMCPRRSFRSDGRDIEYFFARATGGKAPLTTVLLVHGDQSHARYLLPLASDLSTRGYNVLAISQPGYGRSTGPPDLMGPASVRALDDAIRLAKGLPGVDSTRIVVWGIEQGATLATRAVMTRTDLAGAIATRGLYDLWAVARESPTLRDAFVREAGSDSAAWRERSPSALPPVLHAPLWVEYDSNDPLVPSAQAQAFAFALARAGQPAEMRHVVGSDRPLPYGEARDSAYVFLERAGSRR